MVNLYPFVPRKQISPPDVVEDIEARNSRLNAQVSHLWKCLGSSSEVECGCQNSTEILPCLRPKERGQSEESSQQWIFKPSTSNFAYNTLTTSQVPRSATRNGDVSRNNGLGESQDHNMISGQRKLGSFKRSGDQAVTQRETRCLNAIYDTDSDPCGTTSGRHAFCIKAAKLTPPSSSSSMPLWALLAKDDDCPRSQMSPLSIQAEYIFQGKDPHTDLPSYLETASDLGLPRNLPNWAYRDNILREIFVVKIHRKRRRESDQEILFRLAKVAKISSRDDVSTAMSKRFRFQEEKKFFSLDSSLGYRSNANVTEALRAK